MVPSIQSRRFCPSVQSAAEPLQQNRSSKIGPSLRGSSSQVSFSPSAVTSKVSGFTPPRQRAARIGGRQAMSGGTGAFCGKGTKRNATGIFLGSLRVTTCRYLVTSGCLEQSQLRPDSRISNVDSTDWTSSTKWMSRCSSHVPRSFGCGANRRRGIIQDHVLLLQAEVGYRIPGKGSKNKNRLKQNLFNGDQ